MIIGVLNQKGGVGKTTLAVHLATGLALAHHKVLLIDADQQGSALDWAANRQADSLYPVVGLPKATLHREIPQIGKGFEYVVIDGPPRVYDVARSAILASDLVIIPVQPSPLDVWSAKDIVDLINEASSFNEKLQSGFVISRKIVNTAIGRDVVEALSAYELPVFKTAICQRVAFAETAAGGRTVLETEPDGPASHEVKSLVKEVMSLERQKGKSIGKAAKNK